MMIQEIEDVLLKYKTSEETLEKLRKETDEKIKNEYLQVTNSSPTKLQSLEMAKLRNKLLINQMEFVKGNLRSKSIFSPTEFQWKKLLEKYDSNQSLPVTTWRCHLPMNTL